MRTFLVVIPKEVPTPPGMAFLGEQVLYRDFGCQVCLKDRSNEVEYSYLDLYTDGEAPGLAYCRDCLKLRGLSCGFRIEIP